jgi:hypothetical protein
MNRTTCLISFKEPADTIAANVKINEGFILRNIKGHKGFENGCGKRHQIGQQDRTGKNASYMSLTTLWFKAYQMIVYS